MRSSDAMEPLVFSILAGRTPEDIDISFYDERLSPLPCDIDTDLVAMTVETFTARRAYQIAAGCRERGIPVVMGGYHPTLMPDEVLEYSDAIVVGDAEGVWEQVVEDAGRGRLQRVYRQTGPVPQSKARGDRKIFGGRRYAPLSLVQYGRGCRFACDFCSIHAFYGKRMWVRPVRDVVAEIESLDRKLVFFVDDNIFSNTRNAEALFRALIPLKIRWACQTSIDRFGLATFNPRGMSADDLTQGCYRARRGFYGSRSMLHRAIGIGASGFDPYNMWIYLVSNLVSRREIRRKKFIAFGGAEQSGSAA
ncbi:MAG: hypothetical protein U9R74_18235 [Pseudomonadota bacterium]|nr:hypothetical protein [Pseudomonadota bacterium]